MFYLFPFAALLQGQKGEICKEQRRKQIIYHMDVPMPLHLQRLEWDWSILQELC